MVNIPLPFDNGPSPAVQGLKGLRVLDFTWAGAGPMATESLCLMGADVVKVESVKRPDLLRMVSTAYGWGEPDIEGSACFNDMNAGKRSIALDLKQADARALALRLASVADVVCDNMRPGKMEALGLGYEALSCINPRVICCSISATGRVNAPDGENPPDIPGYAPVFWAEGGGASVTGWPDGTPTYLRAPIDMNAGNLATLGILAGLFARARTGRGTYIDCSAIETVAMSVGDELLAASLGLPAGGLRGNDRPPHVPNDTLPCLGEDQWVALSVHSESEWQALCGVLGAEDLWQEPALRSRLHRWRRRDEVHARLAERTRHWLPDALAVALRAAGLAATRSNSTLVLLRDEGLHARGFWREVQHPVIGRQRIGALPWSMEPPLATPVVRGPLLGEHSDQVLRDWLDMEDPAIAAMRASGAIEKGTKRAPDQTKTTDVAV